MLLVVLPPGAASMRTTSNGIPVCETTIRQYYCTSRPANEQAARCAPTPPELRDYEYMYAGTYIPLKVHVGSRAVRPPRAAPRTIAMDSLPVPGKWVTVHSSGFALVE